MIQTSPNNLKPDRDDTFEAILSQKEPELGIIPSATNNGAVFPDLPAEPRVTSRLQCGKLGGAAVLQVIMRAGVRSSRKLCIMKRISYAVFQRTPFLLICR